MRSAIFGAFGVIIVILAVCVGGAIITVKRYQSSTAEMQRYANIAFGVWDQVVEDNAVISLVPRLRTGSGSHSTSRAPVTLADVSDLASLASEQFSYLTTRGRRTGSPHEIEIWFAVAEAAIYMLHGSSVSSDSVRKLLVQPCVTVRIADRKFDGTARVVSVPAEDQTARRLLLRKYGPVYSGDLSDWGRTALPVAVDLQF